MGSILSCCQTCIVKAAHASRTRVAFFWESTTSRVWHLFHFETCAGAPSLFPPTAEIGLESPRPRGSAARTVQALSTSSFTLPSRHQRDLTRPKTEQPSRLCCLPVLPQPSMRTAWIFLPRKGRPTCRQRTLLCLNSAEVALCY